MIYPVLAIERGGFTKMIQSEDRWTSVPLGFINLYKRRLDVLVFYDRAGNKWQLRSIAPRDPIGPVLRLFGLWLGLSLRRVAVKVDFQSAGPYGLEELRAALRSAVEADDDILCQFHTKEQILARLEKAKSIAGIFNLYSWTRKEH